MMNLIDAKNKPEVFENMYNLYVYELSMYDPWLGEQINEEGRFSGPGGFGPYYDGTKQGYVIYEGEKPVGFVSFINDDEEKVYCIEEAFVCSAYRGRGIFTNICKSYIASKEGTITTHILKNNDSAIHFFETLFKNEGYEYEVSERDAVALNYTVKLSK